MALKTGSLDQQRQARAIREDRGRGGGSSYEAFIQVKRNDFASRGRSHIVPSSVSNRLQDLLSELEFDALLHFLVLNPLDILEQVRLTRGVPWDTDKDGPDALGTLEIASLLEVMHPVLPGGEPRVMTTDFLLIFPGENRLAVHVKYTTNLADPRNQELRAIEQQYWESRGVRFVVFTEAQVGRTAAKNLRLVQCYERPRPHRLKKAWLERIAIEAKHLVMSEVLHRLASSCGLTYSDVVDGVKRAIATGRLRLDLSAQPLNFSEIWPELHVVSDADDILEAAQ